MTSSQWYLEVKLSQFNPFDRSRWKIWIAKQQTSNMFAKNDRTRVMQCTLQLARSAAEMEPYQLFSGTKLAMKGRSFRINNSWLCSLLGITQPGCEHFSVPCNWEIISNDPWKFIIAYAMTNLVTIIIKALCRLCCSQPVLPFQSILCRVQNISRCEPVSAITERIKCLLIGLRC